MFVAVTVREGFQGFVDKSFCEEMPEVCGEGACNAEGHR